MATHTNDSIERVRVLSNIAEPIAKHLGFTDRWRIGMGWARSMANVKTFQVHFADVSGDGTAEIFISPKIEDNTVAAFAIADAFVKLQAGKGATTAAQELARIKAGLDGEGTAVLLTQQVLAEAAAHAPDLSNVHAAINEPVKQTTRLLKFVCQHCPKSGRDTKGSVEKNGPLQHCGEDMILDDSGV